MTASPASQGQFPAGTDPIARFAHKHDPSIVTPPPSQLSFVRSIRNGGGGRTAIPHWDVLVDGSPLRNLLRIGDMISPFGWLRPDADASFKQMWLLKRPSDLRPGRVAIFVCPECGDYGCGAVTACIRKEGGFIVWDSFGTENNYSEDLHPIFEHRQVRLAFHPSEYWSVIQQLPVFVDGSNTAGR